MAAGKRSPHQLTQQTLAADSLTVARFLLGKTLVRHIDGRRLAGRILETEAYCPYGAADLACHGSKNGGEPTRRTAVMFGPAGVAYVYFNYGIHWLFNVVTGEEGTPGAVLIRALAPVEGIAQMRINRSNRPDNQLTNGPARLTQALKIDGTHNGVNLCHPESVIWIEYGLPVPNGKINQGPRVGLGQTPEPWYSIPWRFWIEK